MKLKTLTAVLLVVAFLPAIAADGDPHATSGQGRIACQVTVASVQGFNCAPLAPEASGRHALASAERAYVRFTVMWTPTSAWAERLQVELFGNPACHESEGPSCVRAVAVGPSPLTVLLEGQAASGTEVSAGVLTEPVCGSAFCDVPPARVIVDQPYSYVWTYE